MDEKERLVHFRFISNFESVQKENIDQRKQITEKFSHRGMLDSGAYIKAVVDLEINAINKLLFSMFEILMQVYYSQNGPISGKDEEFLIDKVNNLLEGRTQASRKCLVDFITSRSLPINLRYYERGVAAIRSELTRKIKETVLSNRIGKRDNDSKEATMLRAYLTDTISLKKQNGDIYNNIKAKVQEDIIFIGDEKIPVEEGDVISRQLPNGLEELFVVKDRGYKAGSGGISSHYQVKVGRPDDKISPPSGSVIQAIGPNARINIGSVDRSTNITKIEENVFSEIKKCITENVKNDDARNQLINAVDDMEKTRKTEGFTNKYRKFISLAADHMTLLAPFIQALTNFLR